MGKIRPPETLSQRVQRVTAEIPCPYPECAGLSIEGAIRTDRWQPNVVHAYDLVSRAIFEGLNPEEMRAYLDRGVTDPLPWPVPLHQDGEAGDG